MHRFRNILVVADEASLTASVLGRARRMAASNDARLTLVDIAEDQPGEIARLMAVLSRPRAIELQEGVARMRRDRLERLAEELRDDGAPVETATLTGTAFIEIIRRVQAHGHDLVLKGALRGPDRPTLRAPDLHLLRKCPCPVWILNGETDACARRIVAAVDPEPDDTVRDGLARTVMALATTLAERDDARLDVLNAWTIEYESALRHGLLNVSDHEIDTILAHEERLGRDRLEALLRDFAPFDKRMRVLHIKGLAADVIPDHVASEGVDTLVMGTLGRTGIAGFFIGNTAETILNRVDCSVLAVKPVGFTSPVTPGAAS